MGETGPEQAIISQLNWQVCTDWSLQGPRQLQDWDLIIYRPLPMHSLEQALPSLRVSLPDMPILTLCDDENQVLRALQAGSEEAMQTQNLSVDNLRHFALRLRARQAAQQGQDQREQAAHELHQGILKRLAGVLAHEINNPLAALLSFVDMLADMQADAETNTVSAQDLDFLQEMLPLVRQAADRIHQVASDSQHLAENLGKEKQVYDLNNVLQSSVALSAGHHAAAIRLSDKEITRSDLQTALAPTGLSYSLLALFDQSLKAIGRDASAGIVLDHRLVDGRMQIELQAQSSRIETLNSLEVLWHQLRGDSLASEEINSLRRQFEQQGIKFDLDRRASALVARLQFKVQRNPVDSAINSKAPRQPAVDVELAA